ncbi:hypothetical protein Esti_001561 [Eimeria stiedai]
MVKGPARARPSLAARSWGAPRRTATAEGFVSVLMGLGGPPSSSTMGAPPNTRQHRAPHLGSHCLHVLTGAPQTAARGVPPRQQQGGGPPEAAATGAKRLVWQLQQQAMQASPRGPRGAGLISCCCKEQLLQSRPRHNPLLLVPLLLLLMLLLLLLLPADARCCSCRLAFAHLGRHASALLSSARDSAAAVPSWLRPPSCGGPAAHTLWEPLFGPSPRTLKAYTFKRAQAAVSAAASPEEAAATAAAPYAAAEAAAATAARAAAAGADALSRERGGPLVGQQPRYNVGQRRRENQRDHWHRQYVYGPVDPTSAYRRKASSAQAAAAAETMGSPELLLQLEPQRRPVGKRWTLLEELEAGEKVLQAASSAAQEALERLVASARGASDLGGGAPRRRPRAPRGEAHPEPSVQVQLRRAALRAAAEAIEEELRCMQRRESAEGDELWGDEEGAPERVLPGWGLHSTKGGKAPLDTHAQWGPRKVYAASLRQLLVHRAILSAAGPLRGSEEAGGSPPQAVTERGLRNSRPSVSAASRKTQKLSDDDGSSNRSSSNSNSYSSSSSMSSSNSSTNKGSNGSSNISSRGSSSSMSSSRSARLPLLAALLPREGVKQRPSSALLTCQLLSTAAFDETIEVHVHLKQRGSSKGAAAASARFPQRVQGFATLPFGVIPSLSDSNCQQQETGGERKAGSPSEGGPPRERGPSPAAAEAQQVRGKKRGGVWRRPRVIAAIVEAGDEEAAKAAGKGDSSNS